MPRGIPCTTLETQPLAPNDLPVAPQAMEPIAVVGLALRFPRDAVTPEAFWNLLMSKKCTSSEWPRERADIDAFTSSVRQEPSSIAARSAHFLREDPSLFDASFFSITAPEAAALDPQQCMLLETTYQAFENAGIPLETLRGSNTGVYAGTMCDDHKHHILKHVDDIPKYAATGSSSAVLANRISWFYDLAGPSITMDTACSSSLIALHIACQGLVLRETSMAVVGGTNVLFGVEAPITMTRMGFLSPDGRCYSFDERANGYARGEGVGVVVLKRLSDAISNNDTIRAVIRSTGSNQDGYTPGITVPNKLSQARLIRQTYEKAGLDLAATRYFESHGTGTPVGDPLEAAAIGSVFCSRRSPSDPLYIGTLKPNIGHLEGASGVAGLIKTILVLEKGTIPPNTNFEHLNSRIPQEALDYIQFPQSPTPWPTNGLRRASVNSFGFGGSNAHVVVDDADGFLREHGLAGHHSTSRQQLVLIPNATATPGPRSKVLIWSANSENALTTMTKSLAAHFQAVSPDKFDEHLTQDLAYTLSCRRTHHDWRSSAVVDSNDDLKDLQRIASKPARIKKNSCLAFAFTGQGAQYNRMGLHLLQYPVFHDTLLSCDRIYAQLGCAWSILDVLSSDDASARIDHPSYSQPLSTALQLALIELLASFNISPAYVAGHSSGEIAAAYAVGGISLKSACKLSYFRGQLAGSLVDSASDGSMLAVALSATEALSYLDRVSDPSRPLTVACINSPQNVTVGGPRPQILLLKRLLDTDSIFCRELKTGVAYHSPQMQHIADRYRQAIRYLEPGSTSKRSIAMVSSATGDWISRPSILCEPDYWVGNMVQPVRFDEAMSKLLRPSSEPQFNIDVSDIVEVGPHSALQRYISEILSAQNHGARYASALSRFDPTANSVLELAGRLHCSGFSVRLDKVNGIELSHEAKYKCLSDLPAYTFNHAQYAHRYRLATAIRHRPHFPSPLLGAPAPGWNSLEPSWRRHLNTQQFPWLVDHQINGVALFPAAGMLAVAVEAAYHIANKDREISGICVKEATFSNPILINITDDAGADIETTLRPTSVALEKDSSYSNVRIYVRQGKDWIQAFLGTVQIEYEESALSQELSSGRRVRRLEWQRQYNRTVDACHRHVKTSTIYPHLAKMGLQYGDAFQGLDEVYWDGKCQAIGRVSARKMRDLSTAGAEHYFLHPAVLDALVQLAYITRTEGATRLIATSVPARLRRIWFSKDWLRGDNMGQQTLRSCNTAVAHGFEGLDTSAIVVNDAGDVVMALEHLQTTMSARDHIEVEQRAPKRLCFGLETKPDLGSLEPHQLESLLKASPTPLIDYLGMLMHKTPDLRILDLAPEAGTLDRVLQSQQNGSSRFAKYDIAHGSEQPCEAIREKLPQGCTIGAIGFATLDMKSNLTGQGFRPGTYDVVILKANTSAKYKTQALKQLRELLKPGGKLVCFVSEPAMNGDTCHSEERKERSWLEVLSESGFSGVDVLVEKHVPLGGDVISFIISTALEEESSSKTMADFVLLIEDTEAQKAFARLVQSKLLSEWGVKSSVRLLSQVETAGSLPDARILFLPEIERAFLRTMSEAEFHWLKSLLTVSQEVYWITKGNRLSDSGPSLSMVTGLARVLRSENPSRAFTTVFLEQTSSAREDAEVIIKLLGSALTSIEGQETEYIVKDGVMHVQRIVEDKSLDDSIFSKTNPQERRVRLGETGPVELEIRTPSVFDSLRCVPLPEPKPMLDPDEVEVDVHAFGLNFKDVVIALGRLPQSTLGCECTGIIIKVGSNARLKPGARVMMAQNGCMKTVNRCHQDLVVEIPPSLSFEQAAAIPIAGATAYYSLVDRAQLQKGETILVHSGAGATGQMCIQLALLIGAKVYTTVGSADKREFLMSHYGLREDQIFYSRDTSFAQSIMVATKNQGVDVVVNSLAGDRLQASWEVVAPFGRFIELGRTEILINSKLAMAHFAKNVSFTAVAIDDMVTLRPALVQKVLVAVTEMVSEGKLHLPYPLQVHPLSEAEQAFRHLMSGKNTGKMVLRVDPMDVVKVCTVQSSVGRLRPDASYVIAGGFGGLGRSAARWMVSKGARNLILLSRSGPVSESARALVSELRDAGVAVAAAACDVADEADLAGILSDCSKTMPPVRGCLQGTMALRDVLFENMTYEDWAVSIRSKVLASSNLDKLLPRGMDFFILLSSLSGIVGLRGQSNYAAGNTFQDALAHSRINRGEHAISLDLGVMSKIGVIAENADLGHLARTDMLSVEEDEFHALLDQYCFSSTPHGNGSRSEAQSLIGLPTSDFIHSNGGNLPSAYAQPLFSHLLTQDRSEIASSPVSSSSPTDFSQRFRVASSSADAAAIVVEGLVGKLSQALSLPIEDIDTGRPLHSYGVDSLVAVELRNWFRKEFRSDVAIFSVVGAPTIEAVGGLVVETSSLREKGKGR